MEDDRYCTVDEVPEKYGLSKANIHHIVKVNGIAKKKVGVRNLLSKRMWSVSWRKEPPKDYDFE